MEAVNCPVCDAQITKEADTELNELIECPDCGVELEVTGLNPFSIEEAPQVEEDWGE